MKQTATAAPPAAAAPFTADQTRRLKGWTQRYAAPRMGLIEALRDVQGWKRCVSAESEAYLAELFAVPVKDVREAATFYPYFTQEPSGKYRIGVCRNLSCRLAGCEDTKKRLADSLGVGERKATPDGLFSWEETECLGACEQAPAVAVNDSLAGAIPAGRIDGLLAELRSGAQKTFAKRIETAGGAKTRLLTGDFSDPQLHTLAAYKRHGGYAALAKAKSMEPAAITEEVKKSNLRGLGGAGFPVGLKWSTVPSKKAVAKPRYLVCNADESEPGCFKDRALLERNPHALIEGMLIAARAVDADHLFIFIRGEYERQAETLETALAEARAAGLLDKEMLVMKGANAYISGADTALLETMEGKKAWPRQPPPFPTAAGVLGCPTVVNNVETLMMIPAVIARGGDAFAALGVPNSGGTVVYSVSGHVQRPGIYEFPMGAPLADILAAAGGLRGGRTLKAVIPGGTSTPVLTAAETMTAKMDFDSLRGFGTFLGAGGLIVLDDTADMVEILYVIERFLWNESCGQCTPCREGSGWVTRILERVVHGRGEPADIDNLIRIGDGISGTVICALGETIGPVAKAMITKFRSEFEAKANA